jgi:hypothetical protein
VELLTDYFTVHTVAEGIGMNMASKALALTNFISYVTQRLLTYKTKPDGALP